MPRAHTKNLVLSSILSCAIQFYKKKKIHVEKGLRDQTPKTLIDKRFCCADADYTSDKWKVVYFYCVTVIV